MISVAPTPITEDTWKVCRPFLQSALTKTSNKEWSLENAREWMNAGNGQLLYANDQEGITYASAIIGLSNYHQFKTMEVFLMGSDGKADIEPLFVSLIEYAKQEGCARIDVAGRRWVKFMNRFGNAKETYRTELEI